MCNLGQSDDDRQLRPPDAPTDEPPSHPGISSPKYSGTGCHTMATVSSPAATWMQQFRT